MRFNLINTFLCLLIVFMGIALSSSSLSSSFADTDDYANGNLDLNELDAFYPAHVLDARAAKSRFWKRAPQRKFWKRSIFESNLNQKNIDLPNINQH